MPTVPHHPRGVAFSETAAFEILSLPMDPLLTEADVDKVRDRLLVVVPAR